MKIPVNVLYYPLRTLTQYKLTYTQIRIYIYIYIYRERERERESKRAFNVDTSISLCRIDLPTHVSTPILYNVLRKKMNAHIYLVPSNFEMNVLGYIYIYIYIQKHTHTHTHIYIFIYIYCMCVYMCVSIC